MNIVLVEWIDAFDMPNHWIEHSEIKNEAIVVRSVGWLVEPEPIEGYITLATSSIDTVLGSGINIPKVCIKSIQDLKVKK
jgi:hypothetical protein